MLFGFDRGVGCETAVSISRPDFDTVVVYWRTSARVKPFPNRTVLSTEGNKGRLGEDWERELANVGQSSFEALGSHQIPARFP